MEDLLKLTIDAKAGNNISMAKLLQYFKPKVTAICREYFLVGADFDDLIQEGMIGLYKAIMSFDLEKNNLKTYATMCIHRQLQNAVKSANRKKNTPLNTYYPINFEDSDEEESPFNFVIVDDTSDVEKMFIDKEMNSIVISKVKNILTESQFHLLKHFLHGESYQTMANEFNLSLKKVDNELQAIKKKLHSIKGDI